MINFYRYYNGELDNQHYAPLIDQLKIGKYTDDMRMIEPVLKTSVRYAFFYAYYIKGRWVEAEPYIMKDPYYAYRYARCVLKDRWIEAEPYIMLNKWWWDQYTKWFKL
jgi:hypothetical protein